MNRNVVNCAATFRIVVEKAVETVPYVPFILAFVFSLIVPLPNAFSRECDGPIGRFAKIDYLNRERDIREVERISNASFRNGWGADDFVGILRDGERKALGFVATAGVKEKRQVLGYIVYEIVTDKINGEKSIEILNFAIDPNVRRQGVGRRLVEFIKARYSKHNRIRVVIAKSNAVAKVFLKSEGFQEQPIQEFGEKESGDRVSKVFYVYDARPNANPSQFEVGEFANFPGDSTRTDLPAIHYDVIPEAGLPEGPIHVMDGFVANAGPIRQLSPEELRKLWDALSDRSALDVPYKK